MKQRAWLHLGTALLLAALPAIACSSSTPTPTSPTGGGSGAGTTLKASSPRPISPTNGVRLEDQTPVFRFENAQGTFVSANFNYRVELLTQNGQPIYSQVVGEGSGQTVHTYPGHLENDTPYNWRVRAELGGAQGPWSETAGFVTVELPDIDPSNMLPFLIQFSHGHPEWIACEGGSGTACHRFVQDAARAVNPRCDPRGWGLLSKNPGEWQCTRSHCGGLGGEGFGEDILTFGQSSTRIYDVIVGAGAPGARLGWSDITETRRAGNNWACPW